MRIQVLLSQLPGLLRDSSIWQIFVEQVDMALVGEVNNSVDLLVAVRQTGADVVVVGMQDDRLPGVASHLLKEYPQLKILAVSSDGRSAFLYELRPQLTPIG